MPRTGALIVGATQEQVGFDIRNTVSGMIQLLEFARALVPILADASFRAVSVGLRPATPDGLPLIGRLPAWQNVHVASGHFRNGILLAPITGELVTAGITRGAYPPTAAPFRPGPLRPAASGSTETAPLWEESRAPRPERRPASSGGRDAERE